MILLVVAALIILLAGLVIHARWHFGKLEKMGLKTDPCHFLYGNTKEVFEKAVQLEDIRRFEQYGEVYGYYNGREPQVHVCDPEMVREMMIKHSDHFDGKRAFDFGSEFLNEMPDFLPGEKWKIVRGFLTPNFTSYKLKIMSEGINGAIENYVDLLSKKVSTGEAEKYDLRQGIWLMLTDLMVRAGFNIRLKDAENPNNIFAKMVKDFFDDGSQNPNLLMKAFNRLRYPFPFLIPIFSRIASLGPYTEAADNCCKILEKLVQDRIASGETKNDITDMMIEQLEKVKNDEKYKQLKITKLTIFCQGAVFFFAGQDQISSILSYAIYEIFNNEQYLDKLRDEIDKAYIENGNKFNYDCIPKMPFLNACILEAGRLVPFFMRTERVCTKDWSYKDYHFKKGQVVLFPIWAINRNPKYFKDPYNFNPTHFFENNELHPTAFCTFGHGPRNCIGMRFSLNVLALLAATLIRKFDFEIIEKLDFNKMWVPAGDFMAAHQPYHFKITYRNN